MDWFLYNKDLCLERVNFEYNTITLVIFRPLNFYARNMQKEKNVDRLWIYKIVQNFPKIEIGSPVLVLVNAWLPLLKQMLQFSCKIA